MRSQYLIFLSFFLLLHLLLLSINFIEPLCFVLISPNKNGHETADIYRTNPGLNPCLFIAALFFFFVFFKLSQSMYGQEATHDLVFWPWRYVPFASFTPWIIGYLLNFSYKIQILVSLSGFQFTLCLVA